MSEALNYAEQLFGERDKNYTFVGYEFEKSGPQIWYPGARKHIIIQLSYEALNDEYKAYYQMAHEVIHLLSPVGYRNANILEEGLAVYFAGWYLSKLEHKWNPAMKEYEDALEITESLLSIDNNIIKKVRKIEPTISYLKPKHFTQINPEIPTELLNILCKEFHRD